MKIIEIFKRIAGFTVRYTPIALGVVVDVITTYRFEKIVDGILGIVTIFFIYLLFLPEKIYIFKRAPMQAVDQKIIKYFVADFFLAIITYWAAQRATDAILTILKL